MGGNNGNGRTAITPKTKISLQLVIPLLAGVAMGTGAWLDLRWQIATLRTEIRNRTTDRWTKTDDGVYMRDFAYANSLRMPEHQRAQEVSEKQ